MRVTPTLDPRGERRGRAVCGVRASERSHDHASGFDPTDRSDRARTERGMSARAASHKDGTDERFAVEATVIGPQSLVPGVAPITMRDRLEWRAAAPLAPKKPQRGCDHGLFDLGARNQPDMFGSPPTPGAAGQHPAAEPSIKDG